MAGVFSAQPIASSLAGTKKPKRKKVTYSAPVERSPAYLDAQNFVSAWEGGYGDIPGDRGGPTKYGISSKAHPGLNVRGITEKQAKDIYHKNYWRKIQGDELPDDVAKVLFDHSVLSGVSLASKHLQLIVGAKPDGIIGPKTLKKLNQYLQDNSSHELSLKLLDKRRWLYRRIVGRNPSQKKFLPNWLSRVESLETSIKQEHNKKKQRIIRRIAEKGLLVA